MKIRLGSHIRKPGIVGTVIVLLILVELTPLINLIPSVQATISNPYSVDYEFFSFDGIYARDFATNDNYIFAGLKNGSVLRSSDGKNWVKLPTNFPKSIRGMFTDSRGYLFLGLDSFWTPVYRSTDNGSTFHVALNSTTNWRNMLFWYMDEDSFGNLYIGSYGGVGVVFKSSSGGAYGSWVIKLNATETYGAYHIHATFVDRDTNYVYVSYGDSTRGELRSTDGGNTWTQIISEGVTSITKFKGYRYFGEDASPDAVIRTQDDATWETALDTPHVPYSGPTFYFVFYLTREIKGLMYAGTYKPPTLWVTDNGERWVKLFDFTSQFGPTEQVFRIVEFKNNIYVSGANWSVRLRALDEVNFDYILFHNNQLNESSNQVTAQEYIFSGTNRKISLNHVLENATVKVQSVYSENLVRNAGFEVWSDTIPSYWRSQMNITAQSMDRIEGNYSVMLRATNKSSQFYMQDYVKVVPGRWYSYSAWVKGLTKNARIFLILEMRDQNYGWVTMAGAHQFQPSDGAWHRLIWNVYTWHQGTNKDVHYFRPFFRVVDLEGQPYVDFLLDACMIQIADRNIGPQDKFFMDNPDKALNFTNYYNEHAGRNWLTTPFLNYGTYPTSNMTFNLNSEYYSFTNAANGTVQTVKTFSTLFGILNFTDIAITSNIAKIIVEGQRKVTVETFAHTHLAGFNETIHKLSLTVDALSEITSVIKIYAGTMGKPASVSGAYSWSYDETTKIVTVTVMHSSSKEITLEWTIPASVSFYPDTLNLKSKGGRITSYVELPEGYSLGDIDTSSIRINDTIVVDPTASTKIGDHDSDGIPDLMVKFDKFIVAEWLVSLGYGGARKKQEVTFRITGRVKDTLFEGFNTVMIRS